MNVRPVHGEPDSSLARTQEDGAAVAAATTRTQSSGESGRRGGAQTFVARALASTGGWREATMADRERKFTAVVAADQRRRAIVPLGFDPDEAWGPRTAHRVGGTVNGMGVRAVVEPFGDGHGIFLGPAWRRGCGIGPGDEVEVVLAPEGPQRDDLAPDVQAALEAAPDAGAFFDGLAQFYRRSEERRVGKGGRSGGPS